MAKLCEGYAGRLIVPQGSRDVQAFDDALPGFGVRKFASGRACYFVKYNVGSKQRRLTLGAVVPGNLAEMRRRASTVLSKARLGQDAVAEKQAAAGKGTTLGELVPIYLSERECDLRQRTLSEFKRQLERDWRRLHPTPIDGITRRDIVSVIDDMVERNGKVAADRARSALSSLFAWAIDRNYMDVNPTLNIQSRGTGGGRSRVLTEAELAEIWQSCLNDDYGRIVRLLILTLQRRTEIGNLADSEVDRPDHQIVLPERRTKNGRPHIIPLSDFAWEILEGVKRRENRDLLFGRGEGGFSGWSKAKTEIDDRIVAARQRAGIERVMSAWTLHDVRRSGVTHLHERGFAQPHVIEAIVNHVSGHRAGVAGIYNKAAYLHERRLALGLWGSHIRLLCDRTASNIVPLKASA